MVEIPALSDDQWDELVERLTLHADNKLRRLHWRGARVSDGGSPPGGVQATDLAHGAITDFLAGRRLWNRQITRDFLEFLKGVVDSKVNHHAESLENRVTRRIPDNGDSSFDSGTSERSTSNPGANLAPDESKNQLLEEIRAEIAGDELACRVMECIESDIVRPQEIADAIGVAVREVNNAQKRLRRCVERVLAAREEAKDG